jgi:hypothetical protein
VSYPKPFDRAYYARLKATHGAARQSVIDAAPRTLAAQTAAKKSKTLVADTSDSECFSDLRYSKTDGGVYATFAQDNTQYFYPMSRRDAQEWFDDDLGVYFNAEIR